MKAFMPPSPTSSSATPSQVRRPQPLIRGRTSTISMTAANPRRSAAAPSGLTRSKNEPTSALPNCTLKTAATASTLAGIRGPALLVTVSPYLLQHSPAPPPNPAEWIIMDWQTPEDSFPTEFITDAQLRALLGRPPISGGWRDGDPVGSRRFTSIGAFTTEVGAEIPHVRIAYEAFGELHVLRVYAVLVVLCLVG